MPHHHDAFTFLAMRDAGIPLLDARSPAEFTRGHMPGARNLPVLDDEARAAVGTAHARSGAEGAVHVALTLVGPQLTGTLAKARRLFQEHLATLPAELNPSAQSPIPPVTADSLRKSRDILIHCWRGGMRSASLAWLLETGGFTVHILQGGYRAYRTLVREELARPKPVLVLGGMTGSGKTDILKELAARGSQVIDLEGLAGHRGSAFGAVGLPEQQGSEAVENALHEQWRRLNPHRVVWLEDEDRRIGGVALRDEFFEHLYTGLVVLVDVPLAVRVDRLLREYTGKDDSATLMACVKRLRRRLGDELTTRCLGDIAGQRYREAVTDILAYYDKLYARQLAKHNRPEIFRLQLADGDSAAAARQLAAMETALFPQAAEKATPCAKSLAETAATARKIPVCPKA